MSGNENQEKAIERSSDSKAQDSVATARREADGAMKDLSNQESSYREARKGGLRDKSTSEHLGPQPAFFDSSMLVNQAGPPLPRETGDKGTVAYDSPPASQKQEENTLPKDIKYPDGSSAHVEYEYVRDKSGEFGTYKPKEIATADGTWKREKDGWTCYDSKNKNKMTAHLDGEMYVCPNGDIVAQRNDGYIETHTHDNKLITQDAGGTVKRDDHRRVTDVSYPDNTRSHITYDKNGNPEKIETSTGTWKKEKDGWNCYDSHNRKADHLDGDVKVTEDGDIVARQKNGYTETYSPSGRVTMEGFPDGHKESLKDNHYDYEDAYHNKIRQYTYNRSDKWSDNRSDNRSEIHTDTHDYVTSIKRPDGKTTSFEYDHDGSLNKIKNPDGSELRKEEDGWYKYDKRGMSQGKENADYSINHKGDLTRTTVDGKETDVKHLDGTREVKFASGGEMDYDKNGRLERSVYKDGKDGKEILLDYDKHGQLKTVRQYKQLSKGNELQSIDSKEEDGKWWHGIDSPAVPTGSTWSVTRDGKIVEKDEKGREYPIERPDYKR
jgi:YD repeat-containing protein